MSYTHNSFLLFKEEIIANEDRDKIINWCKSMLGDDPSNTTGSGVTVELKTVHYDAAVDDAVQEYSSIINEWSALDNLANTFASRGATTENNPNDVLDITQQRVLSTFGFILQQSNKYSEIATVGGNVTEKRAYFTTTANTQHYNLLDRSYKAEMYNTSSYTATDDYFAVTLTIGNITQAEASNWEVEIYVSRTMRPGKPDWVNITDEFDYLHIDGSNCNVHLTQDVSNIIDNLAHYAPRTSGAWPTETFRVNLYAPYSVSLYDEDGVEINARDLNRKEMEINNIEWYPPSTIFKYFDPYNLGSVIGAEMFGFSYTADTPLWSMPIFYDILRGAQHEMASKVRRNNYSIIENNKRISIWPYPGTSTSQVSAGRIWFDYIVPLNPYEDASNELDGTIANLSNMPYLELKYSRINNIGRRWIHKWSLASCKEVLGRIRGKFTSIPFPNADMAMDAPSLIDEARGEKEELRSSLRQILEKTLETTLLETAALEADSLNRVLSQSPSPDSITMG